MEIFLLFMMFCINPIITEHLEMFFWYVDNEAFDEIHCRDTFRYGLMILMSGVMKGNKVAIIIVDAGSGDDRSAQVSADVLDGNIRGTEIRFSPDIETIWIFPVKFVFKSFEGTSELQRKLFQEDLTESQSEERIIEMIDIAPCSKVAGGTF